jgi:hypothetical protein
MAPDPGVPTASMVRQSGRCPVVRHEVHSQLEANRIKERLLECRNCNHLHNYDVLAEYLCGLLEKTQALTDAFND